MNKIFSIGLLCMISTSAISGNKTYITEFSSEPELFEKAKSDTPIMELIELPTVPVQILKVTGNRFAFKANNELYWISNTDIAYSDQVQIDSLCNTTQIAVHYDEKSRGIRGAGVGCEK